MIKLVTSDFYIMRIPFAATGVIPCWPLERKHVLGAFMLASFFRPGIQTHLLYTVCASQQAMCQPTNVE